MDKKLIFDVGMHRCEDTNYYLRLGFRVVAIDADPVLIELARSEHRDVMASGQLQLVNAAIGGDEGRTHFHRSNRSVWSSLKSGISARDNNTVETFEVPMQKLSKLFSEFGVPFYCKIDIEGYDAVCLASLREVNDLPFFISAETECLAEGENLADEDTLETLNLLRNLGYRKFKLVDQRSLVVLSSQQPIYRARPTVTERLIKRARIRHYGHWGFDAAIRDNPTELSRRHLYDFSVGCSGPFGTDLDGEWTDYQAARGILLRHRREFFRMPNTKNYDFWCDWHATF